MWPRRRFAVRWLSPSTTYYFAMKTADECLNWSVISNSPSGTTSAPPPASETETFGYDFLDRLTSVSGAYAETYTYNQIGNMMSRNGVSYAYGDASHKHAVTAVGSANYVYDSNGNMTTRGTQTLTWDVENRPVTVSGGASFIYDGDGARAKKTENGQTILYVNEYFEKNLTTGEVTTYYYPVSSTGQAHGDKLVAKRTGTTLEYVHQDHLTGTSVVSRSTGAFVNSISYLPYGSTRSGDVPTDKKFTGQRLDSTGLYYYGARYYDPTIGRFVSPDTFAPLTTVSNYVSASLTVNEIPVGLGNLLAPHGNYPIAIDTPTIAPQALNRYSYALNNPLAYVDPYGWWTLGFGLNLSVGLGGGFSINLMFVVDNHGGIALAGTPSAGGMGGATLSAAFQAQYTTAKTVKELQGSSMTAGGSVGEAVIVGVEQTTAMNADVPGRVDFVGWNGSVGIGIGTPAEAHVFADYTGVQLLREPSEPASSPASQNSTNLPIGSDSSLNDWDPSLWYYYYGFY